MPSSIAPWPPPGRRTRWATVAMVPTLAYSPSWRGTSRTRSSPAVSTGRVTSIVGKTTVSSRGISRREVIARATIARSQPLRLRFSQPPPLMGSDPMRRVAQTCGAPLRGRRHLRPRHLLLLALGRDAHDVPDQAGLLHQPDHAGAGVHRPLPAL